MKEEVGEGGESGGDARVGVGPGSEQQLHHCSVYTPPHATMSAEMPSMRLLLCTPRQEWCTHAIPHWGLKGLTNLGRDIVLVRKYASTSSHLAATEERSKGGGEEGQGLDV